MTRSVRLTTSVTSAFCLHKCARRCARGGARGGACGGARGGACGGACGGAGTCDVKCVFVSVVNPLLQGLIAQSAVHHVSLCSLTLSLELLHHLRHQLVVERLPPLLDGRPQDLVQPVKLYTQKHTHTQHAYSTHTHTTHTTHTHNTHSGHMGFWRHSATPTSLLALIL